MHVHMKGLCWKHLKKRYLATVEFSVIYPKTERINSTFLFWNMFEYRISELLSRHIAQQMPHWLVAAALSWHPKQLSVMKEAFFQRSLIPQQTWTSLNGPVDLWVSMAWGTCFSCFPHTVIGRPQFLFPTTLCPRQAANGSDCWMVE